MNSPIIYAHIAHDGRLLEARTDPPVSEETMGGKVHTYLPLDGEPTDDMTDFEARCLQYQTQLAACTAAAEGHADKPGQHELKKGDYAWSVGYQKAVELRRRHDKLQELVGLLQHAVPAYWPKCEVCDERATRELVVLVIGSKPKFCDDHSVGDLGRRGSNYLHAHVAEEYEDLDQADDIRRLQALLKELDLT
jgi:hypothetical protein